MKIADYYFKFHRNFYHPINDEVKVSTIRDESKPVDIDNVCIAYFNPIEEGIIGDALLLRIDNHYAKKFKDLELIEAQNEGYNHPDLLRHELLNIYPNLNEENYVYIYEFTLVKGHFSTITNFLKEMEEELYNE